MCGLCLFWGAGLHDCEKEKKLPTAEQTKILSVHKTELVLGFFFFFCVNNGAKIVPYKGFCQ